MIKVFPWLIVGLATAATCAGFIKEAETPQTPVVDSGSPPSSPPAQSAAELLIELHQCEAKLEHAERSTAKAHVATSRAIPRMAHGCAEEMPTLVEVQSTKCAKGMLCLDERAQRQLAKNLAAWEAYARRCQQGASNAPR